MTQLISTMMDAVEISEPGSPEVLQLTSRPIPSIGNNEVLIKIYAAGINGPDVMQRRGLYAPPIGASDLPGLEIAGEIVAIGTAISTFKIGDRVAALIPGGGYAEYCAADASNVFHIPDGLSLIEAAALPETFMTVWFNLFERGQFKSGNRILIHGGASGIGTTATMLAKTFGARQIITTVGSPAHQDASLQLGADIAILYKEQDFVAETLKATDGQGVDIILDIIAGDYVARNYAAAAMDAKIVQIGIMAGPAKSLDLTPMLTKRLTHIGSTLRARSHEDKAAQIKALQHQVWPQLANGQIKPIVYATFPLAQATEAHHLMDSGVHFGKIVLTMHNEH